MSCKTNTAIRFVGYYIITEFHIEIRVVIFCLCFSSFDKNNLPFLLYNIKFYVKVLYVLFQEIVLKLSNSFYNTFSFHKTLFVITMSGIGQARWSSPKCNLGKYFLVLFFLKQKHPPSVDNIWTCD